LQKGPLAPLSPLWKLTSRAQSCPSCLLGVHLAQIGEFTTARICCDDRSLVVWAMRIPDRPQSAGHKKVRSIRKDRHQSYALIILRYPP
jgi:hypothetical protein